MIRSTVPALPAQAAFEIADEFARNALSPATLRAYRADWTHFGDWCQHAELSPLPAEPTTVAAYLASMALTHRRSTIERRLVSIGQAHKLSNLDWRPSHPAIRSTLKGMFRQHGRPVRKAAALGREEVVVLLGACTSSVAAWRDRAIFLVGFAAALRRSELAGIHREHLTFRPAGVRLFLPRSKGDQGGEGVEIGIPTGINPDTCPVRALRRWIEASGCEKGPVFRMVRANGTIMDDALHPNTIGKILKKRAEEAGLEVGALERLSAHGLPGRRAR
jgi:integrase